VGDESIDGQSIKPILWRNLLFLLQAPTTNRRQIGHLQKDDLIEGKPQRSVDITQKFVDRATPDTLGVFLSLQFVDWLNKLPNRNRLSPDTPTFQHDQVEGPFEASGAGAVIQTLIEDGQLD
jgi:hypothetical protein